MFGNQQIDSSLNISYGEPKYGYQSHSNKNARTRRL